MTRLNYNFPACVFFTLAMLPALLLPLEQVAMAATAFMPQTTSQHEQHTPPGSDSPLQPEKTHLHDPVPTHHQHFFKHLPLLASGEAMLPSNAGNFHGPWNASVDPRTGTSSFSLVTASTLYDLAQSRRDLAIFYKGSPVPGGTDTFGLGPHWTWNIGLEKPSTTEINGHKTVDISTGDGHQFTMFTTRDPQGKTVWKPLRHKLNDVNITGQPGNWTITLNNGTRVHLDKGYEDWEQSQDGHRLWFYYDRKPSHDTFRHLVYLCNHQLTESQTRQTGNACQHGGIQITYQGNTVTVHGQQPVTLKLNLIHGINTVTRVTLPPLSSRNITHNAKPASIRFTYDQPGNRPWLLRQVSYPTGLSTTFLYNEESSSTRNSHGIPSGINGTFIPVVTEQITRADNPAFPEKHLWFHYGQAKAESDEHNYTGYLGNAISLPGRDNLMDRADSYTYTVTQDNGQTRTTTTYNKYHLPLSVVQKEDHQNLVLAQSEQTYLPWQHTTFDQLPANYSLATSATKTLHGITKAGQQGNTSARVIESRQYDNHGQAIWKRDAYGRETYIQYCPETGDAHCPVLNNPLQETILPEKIIQLPAHHSPQGSHPFLVMPAVSHQDNAVEVTFDYTRIPLPAHSQLMQTQQLNSTSGKTVMQGFPEVKEKTTGMVPVSELGTLHPGMTLPELSPDHVKTRTRYEYDTRQQSPVYGQLNRLTVIRQPQATRTPVWHRHNLSLLTPETMTFGISRILDTRHQILKTTVSILPSDGPSRPSGTQHLFRQSEHDNNSIMPLGTVSYSLDTGRQIAATDPERKARTTWRYDAWNRPIQETFALNDNDHQQLITWRYILTDKENAVIKTGVDGNQQKIIMGPDGKVLSTWHRFINQGSDLFKGTGNWIPDTAITWTKTGKPSTRSQWIAGDRIKGQPGLPIALTTLYGYDSLNRPVWTKSPDGIVNIQISDDPHLRSIHYQVISRRPHTLNKVKEQLAPLLQVTQASILGKPTRSYTFAMDPSAIKNGHALYSDNLKKQLTALKSQLKPVSQLSTLDATGLLPLEGSNGLLTFIQSAIDAGAWLTRTVNTYDGFGRLLTQTLSNGATTTRQWKDGRLVATITPDGRRIHDQYNLQGKRISRCVQPRGDKTCHVLGTRGYDKQGNLIWQSDEYGHTIRYAYDQDNRLIAMTTPATADAPKGHHHTWKYNGMGPVSAAIDGVVYTRYRYDAVSWKLTDKEDAISHLHYHYDPNTGWLDRITRSAPSTLQTDKHFHYPQGTQRMVLDRYGHSISFTDIHGNTYTARHDRLGRTVLTQVQLAGHKQPNVLTVTTYDAMGRPATIRNGAGITRTFLYNALGQLASTTDTKQGTPLLRLAYTHDVNTGNIVTMTRVQDHLSATRHYAYDISNNLVSMTCGVSGKPDKPSLLCPRETALAGSHLTMPPVITAQHYAFDRWNNIQSVKEKLTDNNGHSLSKEIRYLYAGAKTGTAAPDAYDPHRMIAFDTHWSDQPYSTKPHTITWDQLGHIIKDADGNTLHYNAFGQQDRFVNKRTGEITRYTYDSEGTQVAEQPFSAENQPLQAPLYLLHDGNRITSRVQNDAHGVTHVSVETGPAAHSEDGVITRWYLHDYKGDVIATFNHAGQKTEDNLYSPYGMQYDRLGNNIGLQGAPTLKGQHAWWQSQRPGFDNEVSDPATGYQFLGGGYRAYNPVYRHFMSKDSFSPFTKINGYGFADNNPVMNTDPSGHLPRWASYLMGSLGMVMSIGLGILLPVATASTVSATAFMVVSTLGGVASGLLGSASGALQMASTAHPSNRPLAIASQSLALASGITDAITGGLTSLASGRLVSTLSGISKLPALLITASGASGALSAGLNSISASMGLNAISRPDVALSNGYGTAVSVINGLSMALMTTSILSGIGAGIASAAIRAGTRLSAVEASTPESAVVESSPEIRNDESSTNHSETESIFSFSTAASETSETTSASEESVIHGDSSETNNTSAQADESDTQASNGFQSIEAFSDVRAEHGFSHFSAYEKNLFLDVTSIPGTTMLPALGENGTARIAINERLLSMETLKALIMRESPVHKAYRGVYSPNIIWIAKEFIQPQQNHEYITRVFGNREHMTETLALFNRTANPDI